MSDYEKQAQKFLSDTNTEIEIAYKETSLYFDDDKYQRDIYRVTLKRGERRYSFEFGNSWQESGKWWRYGDYRRGISSAKKRPFREFDGATWDRNKNFAEPTAYSVLACLNVLHDDSFEDFCACFGYNEDSRKAEKTYNAVLNESNNLKMLYSDSELEQLQEIV